MTTKGNGDDNGKCEKASLLRAGPGMKQRGILRRYAPQDDSGNATAKAKRDCNERRKS
jgi:hypothetical protein